LNILKGDLCDVTAFMHGQAVFIYLAGFESYNATTYPAKSFRGGGRSSHGGGLLWDFVPTILSLLVNFALHPKSPTVECWTITDF
jgi:hypothetical protein